MKHRPLMPPEEIWLVEACQACDAVEDPQPGELAALREEVAKIEERKRAAMCLFCEKHIQITDTDGNIIKEAVLEMLQHDQECDKNPLVQQVAALRAANKELLDAGWAFSELCACYRLQIRPRDDLFPQIDRANEVLSKAKGIRPHAKHGGSK
jgi:hypothetical protein